MILSQKKESAKGTQATSLSDFEERKYDGTRLTFNTYVDTLLRPLYLWQEPYDKIEAVVYRIVSNGGAVPDKPRKRARNE